MSNLYLKAGSESALLSALNDAGLVAEGVVQVAGKADVYVIGAIAGATGYHANVRTDDAEVIAALTPLACAVTSPSFVFA